MLIAIPTSADASSLQRDITSLVLAMDNRATFENIDSYSYAEWVSQQGKPRHIVTLLARQITAEHIASLTSVAVAHDLSFDHITRLSGRIPLHQLSSQTKASVEFSARGTPKNLSALRAAFMELTTNHDIDIAVQEDTIFRRNRRLVCFDMDSTLIEAEVIDELAIEAGVGDEVARITEAAMAGELDFNQSFAQRMALLKGLDEGVLASVAARLKLAEGAERLFKILKQLGYKTAILSGGFDYFGRYLQARLGIDYVYANHLDIVDGQLTGRVVGQVVNGERKAALLRELAAKEHISLEQVIAVGDGANDLPMLSIAGLGIAFRAKPLVKASAKQSISQLGLDAILYLMGLSDRDMAALVNLSLDA
jgi:phosphoserine phosphatase